MLRIPWWKPKWASGLSRDPIDRSTRLAMSVEGQMSTEETKTLVTLASRIRPDHVIVEIGTYRGRSAAALAFGSKHGNHSRVYAIDPHTEFCGVRGGKFRLQDQRELYRNLLRMGVAEIVAVVCLNSVAAAKAWSERNVGLLWLDGNHQYEAVRGDYQAWCPFLAEGAIVAFHDSDLPDVRRLLAELEQTGALTLGGRTGALTWFKWRG